MASRELTPQLCACGCGEYATVDRRRNRVSKYLSGHNSKVAHPMTGKGRHNMEGTPTYNSWSSMLNRCRNPKANNYERWGGRGITVCERWTDFVNFYADMGERPAGTTLDRIDNDRGYEPGNCRWANHFEQARSRSNTKLTESDVAAIRAAEGCTQREIAERFGIHQSTVSQIRGGKRWGEYAE